MSDPYLQLNGTLKNKLELQDPSKLEYAEKFLSSQRLTTIETNGPKGAYTFDRLKETHRYIFQDVYSWAGKTRTTELLKASEEGGHLNRFTPVSDIPAEAEKIFKRLSVQNELKGLSRERFAVQAANTFSDINQLHAFRDGNGRAQRALVSALAKDAGHNLSFDVVSRERMVKASIQASQGKRDMMRRMFKEISDVKRVAALREAITFLDSQNYNWNERYIATTEPNRLYKGTLVGKSGENFMMHDGSKILIGKTSDLVNSPGAGEQISLVTKGANLGRNRGLER